MKDKVEKFFLWKWLLSIQRFLMIICSAAVVLTIVATVVCRYILKINFAGNDEVLIIFALWLYFIGGLYGNYEDSQIKADVLSLIVHSEKTMKRINVLVKFLSLFISIWLAVWAGQYLKLCLKIGGNTPIYHIPMLVSRMALVVGYIAPVVYNVYHFVLSFADVIPAADKTEGGTTV